MMKKKWLERRLIFLITYGIYKLKVIILAGGFGSRISEMTETIPKPMVPIGGIPLILHIMKIYAHFGHKDFYLALGYKSEIVKNFFMNYYALNSDFSVDLSSGKINFYESNKIDWKITLVDTGLNTMTGGRIKRLKKYIGSETFFLTYGDGVSNINVNALLKFHCEHKKYATVTAVRPNARFGEIDIRDNKVKKFEEKPQVKHGWINGGFFVFEPEIFDFIDDDQTILEKTSLELLTAEGQLMAYQHHGFWQCMDTKRDKDSLEELYNSNNAPWVR